MKVLFVATECVPYAKTGGLADVAGALPKALRDIGIDARIVMPRYRGISVHGAGHSGADCREVIGGLPVPISSKTVYGKVYEGATSSGVPIYFIDQPHYFDRKELYVENGHDYADNAERFIFFARGVVEFMRRGNFQPDLVHANDWLTGLIPVYLRTLYSKDPLLSSMRTLFSIHNLAYQGVFWHYDMHLTGLPWELFRFDKLEFYGKLNFMKGGILFSEKISTVSPRYAEEIKTPEFGFGLDTILRKRAADLSGILNGVDYVDWNPRRDPHIASGYDEHNLRRKTECKHDLQRLNNLPETDVPLLGMICRLADQKGIDLVVKIFDNLMSRGIQFVLLGTGEAKYQEFFTSAAKRFPLAVGINLTFSNQMAHKIEAGADLFLMPSKFEPCGLNQMYSMRYGTAPVVFNTGGLADTVTEFNPAAGTGTGFLFDRHDESECLAAIDRALALYRDRPAWETLQKNGMAADWSWGRSAGKYAELYESAMRKEIPRRDAKSK